MTDFYKKYYGYDDDIKLKDDDIKISEKGMFLKKMKPEKEEFNDRFYRLDLINNQLIASTKEFRKKEKHYLIANMNEVKSGCSSDNLKEYKLKKSIQNKSKTADMENRAFVLIYDNHSKSLDLMASNETDRDRWVRVLSYLILLCKKCKGILPETDEIMRSYFSLADKSKDKKLNVNEITKFLESINLKLRKDQLKSIIKNVDTNSDNELSKEEFEEFMNAVSKRKEILSLFDLITKLEGDDSRDYISAEGLRTFLSRYQGETKSIQECKELIEQYERNENFKNEFKLTLHGFGNYLNDFEHHIMDPAKADQIYQNMDLPLQNYFINSSHNTYLSGDQLSSESKVECYIDVLMKGCRLLELDCHDGSDGEPQVFHNYTLTSKIYFEQIIKAVKEYAFRASEYPVILTLENHCSPPQQSKMAEYINTYLSEYLFCEPIENYLHELPALSSLKRKIFIRSAIKSSKKTKNESEILKLLQAGMGPVDETNDQSEVEENENDTEEFAKLLNLFQNVSFKGIDYAMNNYKPYNGSSLEEPKALKLVEKSSTEVIQYTNKFLIKVYPSNWRTDSSNFDPNKFWMCGFQMACLNFQKRDNYTSINRAFFHDNGCCGYYLKPEILRNPALDFNPFNTDTMRNKKILELKIVSAQHLPTTQKRELIKDISDPFVIINVFGVPADECEKKTRVIKDNGYNPLWNEDFIFKINCPELAFIKFTIKDEDISVHDFIGEYTIKFDNMRQGYRHMNLKNKMHKGTLFVGIKIKPLEEKEE